jgi:chromosome segregation ATPase
MSEAMATLSQKMLEVEAELREAKRAGRQDASKLTEYRDTIDSLQEEVNWFDDEYAKLEKECAAEKEAHAAEKEAHVRTKQLLHSAQHVQQVHQQQVQELQQQLQSQGQELSAAIPSRIRSLQTSQGMHKANTEKLRKKLATIVEEQAQTKRRSAKRRGVVLDQKGVIAKQKEAIKLLQRRVTEQDARVDSAVTGHDAAVEELGIFRSMLQGVLLKVIVLYLCVALLCCIHTYRIDIDT